MNLPEVISITPEHLTVEGIEDEPLEMRTVYA